MLYYLMKFVSKIICFLPYKFINIIGNFIGNFTWCLVPVKRKKMAIDNIMFSLKIDYNEAYNIAKKSWTRFGSMIMEVLYFPQMKKNIHKYVEIEGREYLDEALNENKGVVLATAHSGNWELLGGGLALNGYPIVGVAQKQTNAHMDKFINEYRTLIGMIIAYKTSIRDMLKFLGNGKIIGMLMDQDAGYDGVMIDFLSRSAATPQGPAYLARSNEIPIVPVFITKKEKDIHKIIIHPKLSVKKTDDKKNDIIDILEKLNPIIEKHVKKYPEEWFWLHNRWKTQL